MSKTGNISSKVLFGLEVVWGSEFGYKLTHKNKDSVSGLKFNSGLVLNNWHTKTKYLMLPEMIRIIMAFRAKALSV